ncbi:MAG: type II 3-dehydroquinate dehydratase [Ilumatobacteraceae bacterium]|jgi:3-dehydroquinate dehydratase-2
MASSRVIVLSGVNLNLLGQREPEVYGSMTLDDHLGLARETAKREGITLEHVQANDATSLVEAIQKARGTAQGIIINPGAFTHYAWSLHDALSAFDGFVIEVHLSQPQAREAWRHTSVIAPVADGTISGFGRDTYPLAVSAMAALLKH